MSRAQAAVDGAGGQSTQLQEAETGTHTPHSPLQARLPWAPQ